MAMKSMLVEGDILVDYHKVSHAVLTISTQVLFFVSTDLLSVSYFSCEEHYNIMVLFPQVEHESKRT